MSPAMILKLGSRLSLCQVSCSFLIQFIFDTMSVHDFNTALIVKFFLENNGAVRLQYKQNVDDTKWHDGPAGEPLRIITEVPQGEPTIVPFVYENDDLELMVKKVSELGKFQPGEEIWWYEFIENIRARSFVHRPWPLPEILASLATHSTGIDCNPTPISTTSALHSQHLRKYDKVMYNGPLRKRSANLRVSEFADVQNVIVGTWVLVVVDDEEAQSLEVF
eukprot:Pompholyxophrys_punicea_v1_NODE_141_length_3246_cov_17.156064.p1 type:complete len:221 gc:universal NODE_141_length_3246_cov_17.156064:1419-757(-)